jgi:hypothetical protein
VQVTSLRSVAKRVVARWANLIGGDWLPPACPGEKTLTELLETVNYAAGHPEEGRYPRFNVCASSSDEALTDSWRFEGLRPFNVAELRRLIPATDPRKSAVQVEWNTEGKLFIGGIHDLGTSWNRTRAGLGYDYTGPPSLMVEVERPNRLNIYQRQFRVATFSDGEIDIGGLDMPLFLHQVANAGLDDLSERFKQPHYEPVRDYSEFEFIALWNCFAAIANTIALAGHGGAVLILPSPREAQSPFLRRKYALKSSALTDAFVDFINARHRFMDEYHLSKQDESAAGDFFQLERNLELRFESLVENLRFVAHLAECDGAIVLTRGLDVMGFGCEIAAELRPGVKVFKVEREMPRRSKPLEIEESGMRHRSAIKLVSQLREAVALVVSQDGPISGVWSDDGTVFVRAGVRLVNMNLPFA